MLQQRSLIYYYASGQKAHIVLIAGKVAIPHAWYVVLNSNTMHM